MWVICTQAPHDTHGESLERLVKALNDAALSSCPDAKNVFRLQFITGSYAAVAFDALSESDHTYGRLLSFMNGNPARVPHLRRAGCRHHCLEFGQQHSGSGQVSGGYSEEPAPAIFFTSFLIFSVEG
ncbi:MAG: hypothetical protein R2756_13585 [Bacteroidales bacterium]